MSSITKIVIVSLLIILTVSIYEGNTPVTKLTSKDFKKVYQGIWLVEFYAPWCGHCQSLAPEYEKAAKALKGIANIAAIDASNEKVDIQIQGYPTIKLFVDGTPTDYNGQRNANGIVNFILQQFKKISSKRLGGGSSTGRSSHNHQGHGHEHAETGSGDQKDVVILTTDTFEQEVYGDQGAWFVEFYAPWCGHCQRLTPQWAALATNLKGQVKVAKVDATQNTQLAQRFGVKGYPTIKFFKPGQKDDSSAIDYEGGRNQAAMADWARQQVQDLKIFNHVQLTSQSVYDQQCKGRNLCVISFLPSIIDSTQEERDAYLQTIKQVGLKNKGKPFKLLWIEGGAQFELEQKLGVSGIGYPAVVTIFESKKVYGRLRRSFSEQNLQNFLADILKNKAKFSKLPDLPTLKTINSSKGQDKQGCDEHLCTGPPVNNQKQDEQFGEQL